MIHRCFYLTEKENMGLAPLHTRSGDLVVVLYGCALPVILRPVGGCFELVGQGYIHRWMTGEAVDLAEKGELEEICLKFINNTLVCCHRDLGSR
jgi:hypothetical protein